MAPGTAPPLPTDASAATIDAKENEDAAPHDSATAAVPGAAPDASAATSTAGLPVVPTLSLEVPDDGSPYKWSVTTEGLPALSADGKHAVVIVDVPDGGRGYPSNLLVFLSVDGDKVVKRLPLLVADDFKADKPDAKVIARNVGKRLALARTELAKTSWVSLAQTRPVWEAAKRKYEWGPFAGIDVSLEAARLRVRDASNASTASKAALLDRDVTAWRTAPYKIADFTPCKFELGPTLIAVDTSRRVLVLVVSQTTVQGGDVCEGSNDAHAVRLNR